MIKSRIIQLIEFKGIAKEFFYNKIGVTSANFRGKAKESDVGSITIAKILSEIPDANPEWLLTGKGSMLKETKESLLVVNEPSEEYQTTKKEKDLSIDVKYKDLADSRLEVIELLKEKLEYQKKELEQLKKELNRKNDIEAVSRSSK